MILEAVIIGLQVLKKKSYKIWSLRRLRRSLRTRASLHYSMLICGRITNSFFIFYSFKFILHWDIAQFLIYLTFLCIKILMQKHKLKAPHANSLGGGHPVCLTGRCDPSLGSLSTRRHRDQEQKARVLLIPASLNAMTPRDCFSPLCLFPMWNENLGLGVSGQAGRGQACHEAQIIMSGHICCGKRPPFYHFLA